MATVTRLYKPTPAQLNQGAQKSDSIAYLVRGIPYNALKTLVLNGTGITGIPRIKEAHPENPALLCRSLRIQPIEGGSGDDSEVYADFTTSNFPGAGLLHAAVDVTGSQFVLEASFQDVDVQVPVATLNTYTAAVGSADPLSLTAWAVSTESVTETRMILRARWSIQLQPGQVFSVYDMEKFGLESNKLHDLGGRLYLFRAGSVTPRDNLFYEVRASWELDAGTPAQDSSDPTTYKLPNQMRYKQPPPSGFMRSPYNKLITIPADKPDAPPDDPASVPWVVQVPYAVPGDHTRLPGIPNL